MPNKTGNKILWIILAALALFAVAMSFTSCQKENSLSSYSTKSVMKDSINVRIQSVDLDGTVKYSPQIFWRN